MDIVNTRIKLKRDSTANWNAARGFVPLEGELIIYTDYQPSYVLNIDGTYSLDNNGNPIIRKDKDGNVLYTPGIKIGDGKAFVQDLPFIDDELREKLITHINNTEIHVTLQDKEFWNNKVNIDDSDEVIDGYLEDELLIFNRL